MRDIEARKEGGWKDSNDDDGSDGTHALSAATSSSLHTGRQQLVTGLTLRKSCLFSPFKTFSPIKNKWIQFFIEYQ